MARKRIIVNKYGINIDLLSKTRKNIYNIVYIKYKFFQTYDFLNYIYKNQIDFSDKFIKDLFSILIKINEYTFNIMSVYDSKKFDFSLATVVFPLNSITCKILECVISKKYSLPIFALEKLIFASLIIFLKKSSYYCRFKYTYKLNKYIIDYCVYGYINTINSKNSNFEFIFNLIETELKKEAEILNSNQKLLQVLNNKKLL